MGHWEVAAYEETRKLDTYGKITLFNRSTREHVSLFISRNMHGYIATHVSVEEYDQFFDNYMTYYSTNGRSLPARLVNFDDLLVAHPIYKDWKRSYLRFRRSIYTANAKRKKLKDKHTYKLKPSK